MAVRDWLTLLFPQENACHLCQRWTEEGILCKRCLEDLSSQVLSPSRQALYPSSGLSAVISCWPHAATARKLVHQLKYQTDPMAAGVLGEGMAKALVRETKTLALSPVVIPVPLHAERERKRGYNQSAYLAREVCKAAGLEMRQDVLYRTRPTQSMVGLNREERLHAMQGAFAVAQAKVMENRHILLVDDVYTTGATAMACAGALFNNGAASVSVLTACRA